MTALLEFEYVSFIELQNVYDLAPEIECMYHNKLNLLKLSDKSHLLERYKIFENGSLSWINV